MLTDGAGISRAQKIRNIGHEPAALAGLRVCWQGADVSRNCGVCPKCLLTKVNLRMAGLDERLAFDAPLDPAALRGLRMTSLYDARDLAEYTWPEIARDPRLAAEAEAIRQALAAVPPPTVPKALAGAIGALALPEPARRALVRAAGLPRRMRRRVRRAIGGG